jgi:hypothetical protein
VQNNREVLFRKANNILINLEAFIELNIFYPNDIPFTMYVRKPINNFGNILADKSGNICAYDINFLTMIDQATDIRTGPDFSKNI